MAVFSKPDEVAAGRAAPPTWMRPGAIILALGAFASAGLVSQRPPGRPAPVPALLSPASRFGALVIPGPEPARPRAASIASASSVAPMPVSESEAARIFGALEAPGDLRASAPPAAPSPEPPRAAEGAPVPPRRPRALADAGAPRHHVARGQTIRRHRRVAQEPSVASTTPEDHRSILEKLFGSLQPAGSVLAYAPADGGIIKDGTGIAAGTAPRARGGTAVYDVAAHTVFMPDGTRLEAHSGLGDRRDDPRFVHESNRGATPPNVYELRPREQLFHGVEALRLMPVAGSVYGRTGLLAHGFMLGPNGDSKGCVSFRNYAACLRAFQKGEVKRLVVVARSN